MRTSLKKRLEIIIEAPAAARLEAILDHNGVRGWTVLPAMSGRGRNGAWNREGQVSEAGQMVVLLAVVDAGDLDPILERVYAFLERQIGIVMINDVQVVRAEHF